MTEAHSTRYVTPVVPLSLCVYTCVCACAYAYAATAAGDLRPATCDLRCQSAAKCLSKVHTIQDHLQNIGRRAIND